MNLLLELEIASDIWTEVPDHPWSSTRIKIIFGLGFVLTSNVLHEKAKRIKQIDTPIRIMCCFVS
jgi:hypothetical protein